MAARARAATLLRKTHGPSHVVHSRLSEAREDGSVDAAERNSRHTLSGPAAPALRSTKTPGRDRVASARPGAPVVEGCCSVRSQSPIAPSHSYLIVSDAVTECEIAPLVPVTTRVTLREAVEDVVCTPSVELPAPVTEWGLKLAVAP